MSELFYPVFMVMQAVSCWFVGRAIAQSMNHVLKLPFWSVVVLECSIMFVLNVSIVLLRQQSMGIN